MPSTKAHSQLAPTIACLLMALVGGVTLLLWLASHSVDVLYAWEPDPGWTVGLALSGGKFIWCRERGNVHTSLAPGMHTFTRTYEIGGVPEFLNDQHSYSSSGPLPSFRVVSARSRKARYEIAGFVWEVAGTYAIDIGDARRSGASYVAGPAGEPDYTHAPPADAVTSDEWSFTVPSWAVLAFVSASAVPPAVLLLLRWKTESRRRKGLCLKCGYDLRASASRCPECGCAVEHAGGLPS